MPRPQNPKTPEAKAIIEGLRKARLNQAQLAEALDVTPSFISQCATGSRPVPLEKAERMAELLGVSPAAISPAWREAHAKFAGADSGLSAAEAILIEAYRMASIDQKVMFDTLAETVTRTSEIRRKAG